MSDDFRLAELDKAARPRIVIHGGMHKTGTTSVQDYLHGNRESFLKQGIVYPAPEVSQPFILNTKNKDWTPDGCRQQLRLARISGASTLLMSAEVVSTLSEEQFVRLTECFAGHDLSYVFCFRHWREYLPSRWSQYCRRRDSQSFGSYVNAVLNSGHVDLRYDAILDRAVNSGKCRVIALSYDNAMIADQSIIPSVLRAAGLKDCSMKAASTSQYRHNLRPPQDEIETVRIVNGIVAASLRLPQDDLFNSFERFEICGKTFDLYDLIGMLDHNVRSDLNSLIVAKPGIVTISEDWQSETMLRLYDLHSHRFTNKIDQRIFPGIPETKIDYSAMHWSEVPLPLQAAILQMMKDWSRHQRGNAI